MWRSSSRLLLRATDSSMKRIAPHSIGRGFERLRRGMITGIETPARPARRAG